jgi:hypothetical protein
MSCVASLPLRLQLLLFTMLESWANDVVITLAGVILGSLVSVATFLDPREGRAETPRKQGEGFLQWQIRMQRERQALLNDAPRSFTLASFAFFGFVVVLVVAIVLSPLEMHWWFFSGGVVAGYGVGVGAPKLVQLKRLPNEPLLAAVWHAFSRRRSEDTGTGTPAT